MSSSERVYSVLLVCASAQVSGTLLGLLSSSRYDPVSSVGNVSAAKRALAEREYDFVIVNTPLPDGDGTRFAADAGGAGNTVALLMVRAEQYPELFEQYAGAGVFLIAKPLSRAAMQQALDWLASARERLRATERKVLSVEEKMEEIRLVNRAKWLLIGELKMTEPEAHRYMEKQAMDRCVPRRQIAQEIIRTYS